MTAEQWSRLRARFHEAVTLDESTRAALLSQVRHEEPELSSELEALLAQQPADGILGELQLIEDAGDDRIAVQQLGPYRLIREVGRGGMGIVFEAAREEEELQKTVAIKILTASTLDRGATSQFRRERQVLNELNHPN